MGIEHIVNVLPARILVLNLLIYLEHLTDGCLLLLAVLLVSLVTIDIGELIELISTIIGWIGVHETLIHGYSIVPSALLLALINELAYHTGNLSAHLWCEVVILVGYACPRGECHVGIIKSEIGGTHTEEVDRVERVWLCSLKPYVTLLLCNLISTRTCGTPEIQTIETLVLREALNALLCYLDSLLVIVAPVEVLRILGELVHSKFVNIDISHCLSSVGIIATLVVEIGYLKVNII